MCLRAEDGVVGDVEGWDVEIFEHDFGHAFSIGGGVPSWFCHQDWMFCWVDFQCSISILDDVLYRAMVIDYDEQ